MFSICVRLRPQHFTLWSCGSEHGLLEHIWDRSVPTRFRFSNFFSPFSLDLDFCVHTAAPPKYCGTATKVPKQQTRPTSQAHFKTPCPGCTRGKVVACAHLHRAHRRRRVRVRSGRVAVAARQRCSGGADAKPVPWRALRWRYCCDARSTAVLRATAVLPTTAVLSITAVVSTAVIGVLSTTTPPPLCCPRPLCSPPPQCSGPSARWPVWRAAALTTGGHMVQTLHAAQMPHGAIVYSVGAVGTWCPTVQVQHA